jgi:hypothetical protein
VDALSDDVCEQEEYGERQPNRKTSKSVSWIEFQHPSLSLRGSERHTGSWVYPYLFTNLSLDALHASRGLQVDWQTEGEGQANNRQDKPD